MVCLKPLVILRIVGENDFHHLFILRTNGENHGASELFKSSWMKMNFISKLLVDFNVVDDFFV